MSIESLEDLVEFAGNTVAFEVGEVLRQPRRTKAAAVVAQDPGYDDDATDAPSLASFCREIHFAL